MKKVTIYTDGACSGNPGPGGIGVILKFGEKEKEISCYNPHTTNNQMELMAAIVGLTALKEPCEVELYSDSQYLIKGMNEWLAGWKNKNWRSSTGPVKNRELWEQLDDLNKTHKITWIHVRGHGDNEFNNRCDRLATTVIRTLVEVNRVI